MKKLSRMEYVTRPLVATLLSFSLVMLMTSGAQALDCTTCHGIDAVDAHPVDTPAGSLPTYRNITSGAVKGNHNTHSSPATVANACIKCHGADVASYTTKHAVLNHYSIQVGPAVRYNKYTSANYLLLNYTSSSRSFAQTTDPKLGKCSTVDCHFESARTPVWGSDPLGSATLDTCSVCHNALPASGSHDKHIAEYGGNLTACSKCHSDHSVEVKPFQHATSVGRPLDVNDTLTYGGTADQYLPSQSASRVYGNCASASCHGDGRGNTKATPTWGAAVARCSACHDSRPATFSHPAHLTGANVVCASCHKGAVESSTLPDLHGNNNVDVYKTTPGDLGYPAVRPLGTVIMATCTTASCHINPSNNGAQMESPVWGDNTVTKCNYCHAATPTTGGHPAHFNAGFTACNNCHVGAVVGVGATIPTTHNNNMIDVGKVVSGDYGYPSPKAIGSAYGTCSTGSCHTDGRGNFVTSPTWGSVVANCTACHDNLPNTGSHVQHITGIGITCGNCHKGAVQGNTAPALHMNGFVDVYKATPGDFGYPANKVIGTPFQSCTTVNCHGRLSPTWGANTGNYQCTKCHGKGTVLANYSSVSNKQAAPGYMGIGIGVGQQTGVVTGNVSNDPKVGAHDAHMRSTNNLGKPAGCGDCHTVPSTAFASGHMNGSSLPTFSNLVKNIETIPGSALPYTYTKGSVTANYDSLTGTCSNIYCHGATLPAGDNPRNTSPQWTDGTYLTGDRANDCSKCHGYPPTQSTRLPHTPAADYMTCTSCHPHNGTRQSTDPLADNDLHINGNLEATKHCNTCHDYDTRGTTGELWGKSPIAVEGIGAHAMHINYLKARMNKANLNPNVDVFDTDAFNGVCGTCHTRLQSNHEQTNRLTSLRNITFGDISSVNRQFGPNQPKYNGTTGVSSAVTPKTCSNIDCHYKTSPIWQPY